MTVMGARAFLRGPVHRGLPAHVILNPPAAMGRVFDIPKDVAAQAYWGTKESKDVMVEAVSNVRRLCAQVGLINPVSERIWRALGIWD
jgi:hypothetical protein